MSNDDLDFSIVLPCYQQGAYLEATLQSLLQQKSVSFELIVQDGCSTDETLPLLRAFAAQVSFPIYIESLPDGGQVKGINLGLRKAQGNYLTYLNSDDVFYHDTLQKILKTFEEYPETGLIYGKADFIDSKGTILAPYPVKPWNRDLLLEECFICQPACFWRRSVLSKIGYFDETLYGAFDYDFWLRASSVFPVHFLDETLAAARVHTEAKTFCSRRLLLEESCQVQAKHNEGYVSLPHIHELATLRASTHFSLNLPKPLPWLIFLVSFFFYLLLLIPKLKHLPLIARRRYFLPDYPNAIRTFQNPLARIEKIPSYDSMA